MSLVQRMLLCLILFGSSCILSAQPLFITDKGSIQIGGTASFGSTSIGSINGLPSVSSSVLQIAPAGGYFLMQNLSVGAFLGYSSVSSSGSSSSSFVIAPNTAYYFGSAKSDILPFVSAQITYNTSDEAFGYGLGGGMLFVLAKNVGMQIGVTYNQAFSSTSEGPITTSATTQLLATSLGFSYFIW